MEHPCKVCIVRSCCTERCIPYIKYIYENKTYAEAGPQVEKHIDSMSYEEAINYITMVESLVLILK